MGDLISQLPNDLLHKILFNLTTRESVRTSVLSTRWKYVWQNVPGLIFDSKKFDVKDIFDRFLNRDKELSIHKLSLWCCDFDIPGLRLLIDQVLIRGVQFLEINVLPKIRLPVSFYTSETLVNLHLVFAKLEDFDGSEFINLPRLQVMELHSVSIPSDVVLEMLIFSSPVLQKLKLYYTRVAHVNVRSLTLRTLSLTEIESKVVIDTPNLESLSIRYSPLENFRVENVSSSIKICIDNIFTNMQIVQKIFAEHVTDLSISGNTLAGMYENYSRVQQHLQLHEFKNLTHLYAYLDPDISEMLPLYLSSCPKLESIDLELDGYLNMEKITKSPVPQCLQTSIKNANIKMTPYGGHMRNPKAEIEFAKYILENAKTLEKFTLWLDAKENVRSSVLEQILTFRSSASVEMKILGVASNYDSRRRYFF